MGKRGNGETGKWGNGETGKWGKCESKKVPSRDYSRDGTFYIVDGLWLIVDVRVHTQNYQTTTLSNSQTI